jgi:type II secretion system protein L
MPELILRFHDETLDSFDWVIAQEDVSAQNILWDTGSESSLGGLVSSHPMPVIFVIPQQCILMTHFDFPGKATRQILSSIEFQIEDQLGQDIELQHFATDEPSDNSVPITVLKKSIMHRCLSLQKNYGIAISKVIPELFLCPWSGNQGELSVIESHEGLIIRYGAHQGFKCQPALLETMLDQLNRIEPLKLICYFFDTAESYEALKADKYEAQCGILSQTHLNDAKKDNFDLRQREFKRSSVWGGLIKPWKWVAMIFVTLLFIFAYNKFDYLTDLEGRLASLKHQQYELIKGHLAADIVETDNLKKAFIQVVSQSPTNQADSDFISQLVIFTKARQKYASIVISKIGFQKDRLIVDITSTKLNDMEALLQYFETSALIAKMEDLTIKPEFVSGRLVLSGK